MFSETPPALPGRGIRCSPVPPENATYLPIQSLPAAVTAPTYLPIQLGRPLQRQLHRMLCRYITSQLIHVVRRTVSRSPQAPEKIGCGPTLRARRPSPIRRGLPSLALYSSALSACVRRISPRATGSHERAFDRSLVSDASTMFDRYISEPLHLTQF